MFRIPFIAALALLAAAPSLPQPAPPAAAAAAGHSYPAIERIGWTYGDESYGNGPHDQLRFTRDDHGHFNSSMGPDDGADARAVIASIERARPGDAISFSLVREAGALACTGRAEADGRASGTCRFDPDQGFATELARRGMAPDDSDDMLALTLVNARIATVDTLTAKGFRFDGAGDLIAVSALGVGAAYADELRGAGLRIDELGDLIAAKALKIDAQWLGDMARAGYPSLAVGQAIQMRALGVTPDYALRMGRVLHAVHEIE
jgi:hypothetical protein